MADTDKLLEGILNELDITYHDEATEKKIAALMKRGKDYLADKYGLEIDFEKDGQAMELLVSYCRYGRSNAIEQFRHDFSPELTALALRGAMERQGELKEAESEEQNEKQIRRV